MGLHRVPGRAMWPLPAVTVAPRTMPAWAVADPANATTGTSTQRPTTTASGAGAGGNNTLAPIPGPTAVPTVGPTPGPTTAPTAAPTGVPTAVPTTETDAADVSATTTGATTTQHSGPPGRVVVGRVAASDADSNTALGGDNALVAYQLTDALTGLEPTPDATLDSNLTASSWLEDVQIDAVSGAISLPHDDNVSLAMQWHDNTVTASAYRDDTHAILELAVNATDAGVPSLSGEARVVVIAAGEEYLVKVTTSPAYADFVRLGNAHRRAGTAHPCIDALEQVLALRVLVSDMAPHPRTLLTDLSFYGYNATAGEFAEPAVIYDRIAREARLLASGACMLTPTLRQPDHTSIAKLMFFDDPGCTEPHNADPTEYRSLVGNCVAVPSLQVQRFSVSLTPSPSSVIAPSTYRMLGTPHACLVYPMPLSSIILLVHYACAT